MNVTHLAEPVPDIKSMNVLTVGAELNVMSMDVVCAMVKPALKLAEISVNKLDASAKAVMLAARVNVSIALMDLTFMKVNAMHAVNKIVMISLLGTSLYVKKMVSATMLVCATVTQIVQMLMIMTVVFVAWAVMSAQLTRTEMQSALNVK